MSRKGHLPVTHIGWVSVVNCAVLFPGKKSFFDSYYRTCKREDLYRCVLYCVFCLYHKLVRQIVSIFILESTCTWIDCLPVLVSHRARETYTCTSCIEPYNTTYGIQEQQNIRKTYFLNMANVFSVFRDLKRDVAKKLEKLEKRTQRAIVELISKL